MRNHWKVINLLVIGIVFVFVFIFTKPENNRSRSIAGQEVDTAVSTSNDTPTISGPFTSALTPAIRDLPQGAPEFVFDREVSPRFQLNLPIGRPDDENWRDPVVQDPQISVGTTPTYLLSIDGLTFAQGGGAAPSDVNGDVGPNHYMQMINATVINVYDKDGNLIQGPTPLNNFWPSTGCASSTSGDGVVAYDHLADRWVVGQFRNAFANGICIAVSTSPDPLGTYHAYDVSMPTFPDYFKIAVWPDGYYIGANQSGDDVHAINRDEMLVGNPIEMVSFNDPTAGPHSLSLPSDLDGPEPPTDSPNYFLRFVDGDSSGGSDRIEVFEFAVDWDTPANSTFTGPLALVSAPFALLCGLSFDCIAQPGTGQGVDSVTEWPMYRLQYRNFGTHETLASTHAVNVGGDQAGVRWVELRKSGGGDWAIHQESTHAPDGNSRWMAGVAFDQDGNMAVAYNVSSSTVFPSIRYATRDASDPLNTLQAEQSLVAGGGSQTGSSRWSDYTSLVVDPVDDCTFWYTAEYYASTAPVGWNTRIGKFKVPSCGGGSSTDMSISKSAATTASVGSSLTYTLMITNSGPVTATGVTVTDALPDSVSFASVSPPAANCTHSAGTITCNVGTMLNQAEQTITVVVTPTQAGTITNTAMVSANESDPNGNNDMAVATTTVAGLMADLAIDKSTMTAMVAPGGLITYSLVITNYGPEAATGVMVTDTLPAGTSLSGASIGCAMSNGVLVCDIGALAVGNSESLGIILNAPMMDGDFTNSAMVGGDQVDSNTANNSDSATATVQQYSIWIPFLMK